MEFWTSFTGHSGQLNRPLGEWISALHRIWEWFYHACTDTMYQVSSKDMAVYEHSSVTSVQSCQEYRQSSYINQLPQGCVPVNVLVLPRGTINRRGFSLPLANPQDMKVAFWEFLRSLGGELMWQYVEDREVDIGWIHDALVIGTLIGVTDGSYNRIKASMVSRAGWVLTCMASQRILQGSFYEISPKAGSYRGELLGLVAIHTFILAIAKFYSFKVVSAKICFNNIVALNQSSKSRKWVSPGIKHFDLHRAIQTCKCTIRMTLRYDHVQSLQDRHKPWLRLTLEGQLNVICDELTNGAVSQYLLSGFNSIRYMHLSFF
jgi:hypothetical protein